MAYSKDLRKKVMEYFEQGHTKKETCEIFQIGTITLYRWIKQKRIFGTIEPKSTATTNHRKHDPKELIAFVEKNNDANLAEISKHFKMSASGIWRALKRLKITFKKKHFSI